MGIILAFVFSSLAVVIREKYKEPLPKPDATGYSLMLSSLCALASVIAMATFRSVAGDWEIINAVSCVLGYILTYYCSMYILQEEKKKDH